MQLKTYNKHFLLLTLFLLPISLCANVWQKTDSVYIQNLINQAWAEKVSDIECALVFVNEARNLSQELFFHEGEANALHTMGVIYWYKNDLPSSFKHLLEALEIRQKIGDKLGLGRSYNNIGNIYFEVAQYDTAFLYYQKSLTIREELQDTAGLIFSLSNVGDVFLKKENYQKAFEYYKRSEKLAIISDDNNKLAYIKGRLGDFSTQKGFLTQAKQYWNHSLTLAEKGNDKRQLAKSLYYVAEIGLREKKPNLKKYSSILFRAILLAKQIKDTELEGEAILQLTKIAVIKEDYDAAAAYKSEYQRLIFRHWQQQVGRTLNEVKTNFETQKITNQLIQKEKLLSLRLNQLWIFLIVLSFFLVLILIINYKKRYKEQLSLTRQIKQEMQKVADKNKALIQSNEVLEKFAFAASHDLKEPLRNIGAFTDLLNRRNKDTLNSNSKEYIGFILGATRQMHQVLNDLLAFAKLTHAPLADKKVVNMSSVVNHWIRQNEEILDRENINIKVAPLPNIYAYSKLIAELVHQLLHNAIKFQQPDTAIDISINYSLEGRLHVFSIQDNGIGMDPVYSKKIFETFQRLDKNNFSGTGMGLALCKRIMKHHNGRIWVDTEEGKGSCFYFSFTQTPKDLLSDGKSVEGTKHNRLFAKVG